MIYVNSITVGPKNIKIKRGTWYYDVYADVCPINATNKSLDWHSSNPNVASVNCNGDICGVSEGTATIYATATDGSGVADFCNVTVQEQVKVHAVAVTPNEKTVAVGEQFSLSAQAYPETADNRAVRWSSDDTNIAQVKYQWGCITAKAVGTTKIHATATDGSGIDGYCTVTVKQSIPVTSITIARTHTMNIGDSYYIKPTILPTNATNKNVRWSSSSPSVAEIDGVSGIITAKMGGTTTITATTVDGGFTSSCTLTVNYCGYDNYRDVTQHELVLQDDGYYVCSKCGYRVKSPALQDRDILSDEDYFRVLACYTAVPYYANIPEDYIAANFDYVSAILSTIESIRSKPEYAYRYEYVGADSIYKKEYDIQGQPSSMFSMEYHEVTSSNLISHNGVVQSIIDFALGFFIPTTYKPLFVAITAGKEYEKLTFLLSDLATKANYPELGVILDLIFLGCSEDKEVQISDRVVYLSFNLGMYRSKIVFDKNGVFKLAHNTKNDPPIIIV